MEVPRIAVIGVGVIGRTHARLAHAEPACDLVGICDSFTDASDLARDLDVRFFRNHLELIEATRPDGVIIAVPTDQHAEIGQACAARGIHLLVEKPIAATLPDAMGLIDSAQRHGVKLAVGHHRRFNPLVRKAREVVRGGGLGRLVAVSALFTLLKPKAYYQVPWRRRPGGGPILINVIHDLDSLRFICGDIASVQAQLSNAVRGLEVEDTAACTLSFENGCIGTLILSDATPAPWSHEITTAENPVYPHVEADCYRFLGTEGALAFPTMELWRYPAGVEAGWHSPLERQVLEVARADPLVEQLRHFCRVVRGQEAPLVDGLEAAKTLAATLALADSSLRGAPVTPGLAG